MSMSKHVTHTFSMVAIISVCGGDTKILNCKGYLDRPVKLLKGMHRLQTKGCIALSAMNLQRLPDKRDLQEMPMLLLGLITSISTGRSQAFQHLLQACYISSISLSCTSQISL